MSYASASVTTSASSPSITARACAPEPPCDCLISTSCPVRRFHSWANAALMSLYSSRVGSYDTLSSVTFSCAAAVPADGRERARAPAPVEQCVVSVFMSRVLYVSRASAALSVMRSCRVAVVRPFPNPRSPRARSEPELQPREHRVLRRPHRRRVRSVELRALVVRREQQPARQAPVEPDARRPCAPRLRRRIGERRERVRDRSSARRSGPRARARPARRVFEPSSG